MANPGGRAAAGSGHLEAPGFSESRIQNLLQLPNGVLIIRNRIQEWEPTATREEAEFGSRRTCWLPSPPRIRHLACFDDHTNIEDTLNCTPMYVQVERSCGPNLAVLREYSISARVSNTCAEEEKKSQAAASVLSATVKMC
jgi:hypothetical protein